jgi:hypothetical protein
MKMKKYSLIVGALILSLVNALAYGSTAWDNTLGDGDINNAANWGAGLPKDAVGNLGAIVSGTLILRGSLTIEAGGSFTYLAAAYRTGWHAKYFVEDSN